VTWSGQAGKTKRPLVPAVDTSELRSALEQSYRERLRQAIRIPGKEARQEEVDRIGEEAHTALKERFTEQEIYIGKILHDLERDELRSMVLVEKVRADGRGPDDIRPITVEVGTLPRTHGSCLFTRGETQALSVATLGTKSDEQRIEELEGQSWKSYMLHYNFPPFSVGEVRPIRGPGRREIGHGALAERAIEPVIPADTHFPYTIRVVSDILESNGSSSMATVCAGSMALMDAGVPIKAPVAGIAMGLIKEGERVEVLTDILGVEDHLGDMDFKVTGTPRRRDRVPDGHEDRRHLVLRAVGRARSRESGRVSTCSRRWKRRWSVPAQKCRRRAAHPHPPHSSGQDSRSDRPGGKIIKRITEETGAQIDIEDTGEVRIAAVNSEGGRRAEEMIRNITEDPEPGRVYQGKVRSVVTFGAFVEIVPGRDGLLHISEIDHHRVARTEDVLNVGDLVMVKVIGVRPGWQDQALAQGAAAGARGWSAAGAGLARAATGIEIAGGIVTVAEIGIGAGGADPSARNEGE
jgi:polyribonucleotide nucleotidyltransferase